MAETNKSRGRSGDFPTNFRQLNKQTRPSMSGIDIDVVFKGMKHINVPFNFRERETTGTV